MNAKGRNEDASFLLLLVPFVASAGYALVLWAQVGASAILPESVYLQVTKDPYLFLIGFLSVMAGCVIEITGRAPEERAARVLTLSRNIQSLAILSLILALLAAWYASGFDVGGAVFDLLDGRFAVVFPTLLIVFSFLLLPSVTLRRGQLRMLSVVVCCLAVPVEVYEVGKRNPIIGLVVALVLIALGVAIASWKSKS